MPKTEIYCKLCGVTLTRDKLAAHLKKHSSLEPTDPMSIFGVK
jgi:hypothetical protein